MNYLRWIALSIIALLSNHINVFFYDVTQPLIPYMINVEGVNPFTVIVLHIIVSNLLAAVSTVCIFAFIFPNRPILVPVFLAAAPFLSWLVIYTNRFLIEANHLKMLALVMGVTLLVIPVLYSLAYGLGSRGRNLFRTGDGADG